MAHFVTCREREYYSHGSRERVDNDPVNLDFCTSISKNTDFFTFIMPDQVHQEKTFELVFNGVIRNGKTVSWLFQCETKRDSEYDRIGKEQLRK